MNEWIPIKTRPLTEEEKNDIALEGCEFMYDCPLPDDGQEVLVTDRLGYVGIDTFFRDYDCYFESNCGEEDVLAWMPLPKPYKP